MLTMKGVRQLGLAVSGENSLAVIDYLVDLNLIPPLNLGNIKMMIKNEYARSDVEVESFSDRATEMNGQLILTVKVATNLTIHRLVWESHLMQNAMRLFPRLARCKAPLGAIHKLRDEPHGTEVAKKLVDVYYNKTGQLFAALQTFTPGMGIPGAGYWEAQRELKQEMADRFDRISLIYRLWPNLKGKDNGKTGS